MLALMLMQSLHLLTASVSRKIILSMLIWKIFLAHKKQSCMCVSALRSWHARLGEACSEQVSGSALAYAVLNSRSSGQLWRLIGVTNYAYLFAICLLSELCVRSCQLTHPRIFAEEILPSFKAGRAFSFVILGNTIDSCWFYSSCRVLKLLFYFMNN